MQLTWLLILIQALFEGATDLYLPAMPQMADFFGIQDHYMHTTISIYLVGFGLSGLIFGPLSDRIGRRPVLLYSLGAILLGSIFCSLATDFTMLMVARFVQGLGSGSCSTICTAIVRDVFEEKQASKVYSSIGAVVALTPMVAPIIGGGIITFFPFQTIFWLLTGITLLFLSFTYFSFKESYHPTIESSSFFNSYKSLLNRQVVLCSLTSAATYGALWAWIVEAPFYFMKVMNVDPAHYGYYMSLGPLSYSLGTLLNKKAITKLGVFKMLRIGVFMMVIGSTLALVSILVTDNLWVIYPPICLFSAAMALVFANTTTLNLSAVPGNRGTASAFLNAVEIVVASFTITCISYFHDTTLKPAIICMVLASYACLVIVRKKHFRFNPHKVSNENREEDNVLLGKKA